jgi:hypothetical protein
MIKSNKNSATHPNISKPFYFFAFSPSSTRRRMASEREGSGFCFAIH